MEVRDKVVIVTGAAAGIGRGVAEEFVLRGAIVLIADIDVEHGEATAEQLRRSGNRGFFIPVDVSDGRQVRSMVERVIDNFGRIDTLVNNAGVVLFKPLLDMEESEWDHLLSVDLKGAFLCSKQVLPTMMQQGSGVILNIASNHALSTLPDSEAYAAAKSAMVAFTKSLALSYGPKGIRSVAICPGFTDTPHYQRWLQDVEDPKARERETLRLHPLGRIVSPADVGKLAVFLASEDASMITGTSVVLDGGVSAQLYVSE